MSEARKSVTLLASVCNDTAYEKTSTEVRFRWYCLGFVDFIDLNVTMWNRSRRIAQNWLATWWRSIPALIDIACQSCTTCNRNKLLIHYNLLISYKQCLCSVKLKMWSICISYTYSSILFFIKPFYNIFLWNILALVLYIGVLLINLVASNVS